MFYFYVHKVFKDYKYYYITYLGSVFGICGGIALIGVVMTPSDLYLPLHDAAAKWLFRSFFIASVCYSLAIYQYDIFNKKLFNWYWMV